MTPITRLEKYIYGIVHGAPVPEYPKTRIEAMLDDIKKGNVVTMTPITRSECYLARISGADVQIPTPITREETFLAKIAGVSIDTPSPIVRIETLLNEWASGEDPLNTFTGEIVRFLSRFAKPIKSIVANFTPVQDLNGQDAPYPPGGGKNLHKPYVYTNSSVGVTFTYASDGSVVIDGTATGTSGTPSVSAAVQNGYTDTLPAGTYTISLFGSTDNVNFEVYNTATTTQLATKNNPTFTLAEQTTVLFRCGVSNGKTYDNQKCYLQLESGSTASTQFYPYENICPISGHTGCEVVRTGKNMLPTLEAANAVKYNGWGLEAADITSGISVTGMASGSGHCVGFLMGKVGKLAGQSVTLSCTMSSVGGSPRALLLLCDNALGNRTNLAYFDSTGSATAIIPQGSEDRYIAVSLFSTTGSDSTSIVSSYTDIQLELGSTASDFEAYQGTTVSISFGTTVYGGTLTVFEDGSGQAVADREMVDLGTLFWGYDSANAQFYTNGIASTSIVWNKWNDTPPLLCSRYKPVSNALFSSSDYCVGYAYNSAQIRVKDSGFADATTFKTAMDGVQLVYELAEPVTIPLTASQIQTLVGENVVFVNSADGDITVQAYGTLIE